MAERHQNAGRKISFQFIPKALENIEGQGTGLNMEATGFAQANF